MFNYIYVYARADPPKSINLIIFSVYFIGFSEKLANFTL